MASAFQVEDHTDEDFFDKLVDDELDGSQPKSEEITRNLSNLSLGDVATSLDGSADGQVPEGVENVEKIEVLKTVEDPKKDVLVSDDSLNLEASGSAESDRATLDSHDLMGDMRDGSKGNTNVKVVQWSAFSVDNSEEFEKAAGLEPFSDFLTENSDGLVDKSFKNLSSSSVSTELQDMYGMGSAQTADQNDPQYWETLYPGWKFDASTGQWYQVDSYDTTMTTQFTGSDAAGVQSTESYLQQTSQSTLETIHEDCTVSNVSNWNNSSQVSMEYPANMVFDPQYPGWYYDTNTENWYTLESYTQGLVNNSNSVQDQLAGGANVSTDLNSEQNGGLYSHVGQSEQHVTHGNGSQEFGRGWDGSTGTYSHENSLFGSNIGQITQDVSQNQGNQDFTHVWDASVSDHDQKNSLYLDSCQSELTTTQAWGSQEFGKQWNTSVGNVSEYNSSHSNTGSALHHSARSQGSQDLGQNWNVPMSDHSPQSSLYSMTNQTEQQIKHSQGSPEFGGNWDASRSSYSQPSMWKPKEVGGNSQTSSFTGNQQIGSSSWLIPGNQTTQGAGFKAFEPVTRHNHGISNGIAGQSFAPKESVYEINQPKLDQTFQDHHLASSYYADQNAVNYHHQPFQGASAAYPQYPYAPKEGRSSAGRPPHALVSFGFGGKLIVMKHANSLAPQLDYGSQGNTSSAISVLNLSEVVAEKADASDTNSKSSHGYFRALCQSSFHGPLAASVATKDLNKWIDEKIGSCGYASTDLKKEEHLKLLFSLLKIMSQNYGKLRSSFGVNPSSEERNGPESAVSKLFASARTNCARSKNFGSLTHCIQNLPSEAQIRATAIEVQNLLVSGRRKEALQCAQEGQLWGPALVLAAQSGEKVYADTVKEMALHYFVSGSPLRTLCLLLAGRPAEVFSRDDNSKNFSVTANGPAQVLSNGMLDDWEENLAIITANRTQEDELVILHLGDCLLKERGEVIAAHACYLVAEANFEPFSNSARLCLIGADHWNCPRTYASPEAIQRTELYEYSKVLGNSQFVLLPFQPYKLIYAYMLAEVGKISESLRYCQASLKSLKTSGRAPDVELWRTLLLSLEERLRTHQQGGYSSDLAPGKIVNKLLNSFDNTIHRMMGTPSAPLPPLPHGSPSSKESFSSAPKLSCSQSRMASPSIMPSSVSVEANISEWTGDGNKKPLHNRSISEPDFGRRPKQDAASADGQTKASVAPSRFGQIGSQLLQKTMGWVSRSRSDRQAKLGESNKFYYDEKLKRWVEEGAEPPAEEASLPPPPPTTAVFQNGTMDYNINGAFKNEIVASNGGLETRGPAPSEPNPGFPPIPPSQNQFSVRGRAGIHSRYVDTFNRGGAGGSAGPLTSSFRSPAAAAVKPASGAKFFVPMAPAPSDEQRSSAIGDTTQVPPTNGEPPTSLTQEASFSSPSTSLSPSASSLHRFPSMDNIAPSGERLAAAHGGDSSLSRTRAASWSGSYTDTSNQRAVGLVGGSPPKFLPQNLPSTRSSSSSSLQLNGGHLGDELQEVEL